ncbi:MAG: molecular chaperone DnaJ [Halieaceae bacterium]
MPRLILLLAIAAVVYILFRRAQSMPPHKRRAELIKLGVGVAVVVVIGLTMTGRMHWLGAALTGLLVAARQLLPMLIRFFPMLTSLKANAGPSSGQRSTVATDILRMQLDHDSGKLQGEVLQGPFKEWLLDEMDRDQLMALLSFCQAEDDESAQLLSSYLQQRFPGESDFQQQQAPPGNSSTGMSRQEALAVLGLPEDADREAIIAAHRSLMQKLHPDRGGNDYLAAKVNQAKDLLLE